MIGKFDLGTLPAASKEGVIDQWETIQEQWNDIDVAASARFGVAFLEQLDGKHRGELLRYFSGENVEHDIEGGIPLRTICALRIWAVIRPGEMKAWIGTLKDADMQKALTWLLDHPWGKGKSDS